MDTTRVIGGFSMDQSAIIAIAKSYQGPRGLVVRSLDGRSFFLSPEEVSSKALSPEISEKVSLIFSKVRGSGVAAPEDENCRWLLKYLLEAPIDGKWVDVADWFLSECTGAGGLVA
jgi:hypothetical protein